MCGGSTLGVGRGEDALVDPDPILAAIASQAAVEGRRAPGFWLPDGRGRLVGSSDFAGRPMILAFWGPAAPASARALKILNDLATESIPQDLACVAVCLDRDAETVGAFKHDVGEHVISLWDRGRHFGDGLEWSDSPLATAYDVSEVPTVFLLDRERRVVEQFAGEIDCDRLRRSVGELLAER